MNDMSVATLWGALEAEAARLRNRSLRQLFADDPERFGKFSVSAGDLLIDFSKEKLDEGAWSALFRLAEARGVAGRRDAMFTGEAINETEGRAVLHTALRGGGGPDVIVDGERIMPEVEAVL
ncbi:MAG: glucose-6-phosphate isomerase, partial [Pseudomonadota bacterium]